MKVFRLISQLYKAHIQHTVAYPGMMFIWAFTLFATPIVMLFVWLQITSQTPALQAQQSAIVSYYLLIPAASLFTSAWHDLFFANKVRTGELSSFLIKPFNYIYFDITNNMAEKSIKSLFLVPVILLAAFSMQHSIAIEKANLSLFIISLLIGAALEFTMKTVFGFLGFWLTDISGLDNFKSILEYTFGGRFIPFFLFPPLVQSIAVFLPFRYLSAFPVEIISGALSQTQIMHGLVIQFGWISLLLTTAWLLWKHGLKNYSAVGG